MIDTQTLGTGIKALYDSSSGATLRGYTGNNKMFQNLAPQGSAFPYIIFTMIDDVNDDTFGEEISVCRVQFSIFTQIGSSNNTGSIQRALKALYHGAALTLTGYTHIGTQYIRTADLGIDANLVSNVAIDFYIWTQKT